jgi:hypothetical protein
MYSFCATVPACWCRCCKSKNTKQSLHCLELRGPQTSAAIVFSMEIKNRHVPWWQQTAKFRVTPSWSRTTRNMGAHEWISSHPPIYMHQVRPDQWGQVSSRTSSWHENNPMEASTQIGKLPHRCPRAPNNRLIFRLLSYWYGFLLKLLVYM